MKEELGILVIGLGSAGSRHARTLAEGRIEGAHLARVYDPLAERMLAFPGLGGEHLDAELARPDVHAVVIAAPHARHVELSQRALEAGKHVLVEKPLGVHKAECERLLASRVLRGRGRPLFGVVHDFRAHPRFTWLKSELARVDYGRLERVVWQATDWYRTEAYYGGSAWRGRFASEGGGLLVNQAPHLIDTLIWLFGRPRRVHGFCRFGRFHDIEVEDDVTAMLEFAGGASALLIASTGESPGTNRLELSLDRGRIVLEEGGALVHRSRELASTHRRREAAGRPLADVERVELPMRAATGVAVLQNFVRAVAGDEPLLAPAEEAVVAVETANAVLWSSLLGRPLELPIDGPAFEAVLAELAERGAERAESSARRGPATAARS